MSGFNLSAWAVAHRPLVVFLMLGTLLTGLLAFQRLGRLEDPVFNVPTMTVVVAWPGASPRELQDQVLNRLERAIQEVEGLDRVVSFARAGQGGITVWMQGGTPRAALQAAWYQVRKKIGDLRHQLPEGVRGPYFNDEFSDVHSMLFALAAPELAEAERQALAEDLKRRLQAVPGVVKVEVLGRQAQQLQVEVSPRRLAALGLSASAVVDALARSQALQPAGILEGTAERHALRIEGRARDAAGLAELPLAVDGRVLRLRDVAAVREGVEDPPAYTVRRQGVPVLALGVVFSREVNAIEAGRAVDAAAEAARRSLPQGVSLEKIADQPRLVDEAVWEFERAFLEALAIVLGVCFLALGWRSGLAVAASVPLVLAVVAAVMLAAGWPLDRISLGALIIALGLLVDDAIIAVEMMVVKVEEGWDRARAAAHAWTATAFPMLTGTLVTVAGFMPVGLARSISGEYAGGIFWVVGIALLASWAVALLFTPVLGTLLLPRAMQARAGAPGRGEAGLRRVVQAAVRHRGAVLALTALLFAAAVAGLGRVPQQFFPTASRSELLVDLRLREGASFEATAAEVRRVEALLAEDPEVQGYTAYTGAGAPRFFLSLVQELPNPGYAQFVVETGHLAAREAVRARLLRAFAEDGPFPALRGRVQRLEFGPPVGFPVQFRVSGPDLDEVRRLAAQVRDVVRASPLVRDTHLDWQEQVRQVQIRPRADAAMSLGITRAELAQATQLALSGVTVAALPRGEESVAVMVRARPEERDTPASLLDLPLASPQGPVPLGDVATVDVGWEEPVLWRRNRQPVLTVRSDLADGVQGPDATRQIAQHLAPLVAALPPGYTLEAGGAIEESERSNRALFAVFPAMFGVTLLLLMVQLQSFTRVGMVFLTAPLGLIGVVPALLAFQAPFGFVALLGVIALGGMIMRNAVILVDQIDRDARAGEALERAVVEATVRRARPVLLTAAAAILAMIPLTRSVFWGPMAMAIMGGLIAATLLTLVVVPALYATGFRVGRAPSAAAA